jgi:hypothetical protein
MNPARPSAPDPEPGVTWRALALQLFVLPAVIVAACVGVFLLFGSLTDEGKDAKGILEEIRHTDHNMPWDRNARWYAALELPQRIAKERDTLSRDPAFCRDLIGRFEDARYPDPEMRAWMAISMGKLGDPRTIPALVQGLSEEGEEPKRVRYACAWALGALQAHQAVPELSTLLADPFPSVRKMAAYALGALGDPAALMALRKALEDPVPEVRWTAAIWLGRRGIPAASPVLGTLLDPKASASLPPAEREALVTQAAKAAGVLRTPALKTLVEALTRDASPSVRLAAQEALIAYAHPERAASLPLPTMPEPSP